MRNGKEYQQSIHQQIVDLLEKGHLGNNERSILNKLDFGTRKILFQFDLKFYFEQKLYHRIYLMHMMRNMNVFINFIKNVNQFLMLMINGFHFGMILLLLLYVILISFLLLVRFFLLIIQKASTDPGRFHTRGYNAEVEGRKRKKYLRELPKIEQEFLNILSEYNDPSFLINDIPIRQKFDEAHHQVPSSALPSSAKTVAVPQLSALTPVRSRTPAATVCRIFFFLLTICVICSSLVEQPLKKLMFKVQHVVLLKHQLLIIMEENY